MSRPIAPNLSCLRTFEFRTSLGTPLLLKYGNRVLKQSSFFLSYKEPFDTQRVIISIRLWSSALLLTNVSFCISTTWWVSLLVDQSVPEGTWSQVLRSTSVRLYIALCTIGSCIYSNVETILSGTCHVYRLLSFEHPQYFNFFINKGFNPTLHISRRSSPFLVHACAPVVETKFLELAMSLLDF